MIVYYSFDKDEKEVTDDSGNGFDGEISGAEWSKVGKDNEADIQHLNGFIDEFAFYTRALSEDEIKADMNNGVLFAVDPANKLSTTWANIKAEY